MILASLIMLVVVAPESAFSIMIGGANNALTLAFTLIAIYAIWLSILSLMDGIGLNKALNKLFRPLTKRLFKGESDLALEYITLNFSANLLGMGGAATPLGIKAMECMQDGSQKATDNMILFMVINSRDDNRLARVCRKQCAVRYNIAILACHFDIYSDRRNTCQTLRIVYTQKSQSRKHRAEKTAFH